MTNLRCLSAALGLAYALGVLGVAVAEAPEALDATHACLAKKLDSAPAEVTVGALRQACATELAAPAAPVVEVEESLSERRVKLESHVDQNPFALAAYKQNYILPYSYVTEQNPIYNTAGLDVDHEEAKFQFSFRFPLSSRDLFVKGDGLDLGYTQVSFWQLYNSASAPFRETNYDPEIFYTRPLTLRPRGADTALRFGLEHESNGRGIVNGYSLSRSWNRVYAKLIYAKDDYVIAFRPWYRIPERAKTSPTDAGGDDNPDIEKYMGYFDLTGAWQVRSFEFSVLARDNLRSSHNLGAIELGMSFPLYRRIRGYAQYFNGYGESLIDYNHSINRVGVGFLLTDIL